MWRRLTEFFFRNIELLSIRKKNLRLLMKWAQNWKISKKNNNLQNPNDVYDNIILPRFSLYLIF